MGADPFHYLQTFPSNPPRTEKLFNYIDRAVPPDLIPQMGKQILTRLLYIIRKGLSCYKIQ
jgi:hypothetical protein